MAYCLLRNEPAIRRNAFWSGLTALGYEVRGGPPQHAEQCDVLVVWNRYGENHQHALRVEKNGGIVIVAENGYLGQGGSRFAALEAPLSPWREAGSHILVCPNRSFGRPDLVMPSDWAVQVSRRLNQLSPRITVVRQHPGTHAPARPLEADLARAWCVVVWSSSAGVHALRAGVPVICLGPAWVLKDAAGARLEDIERPPMPDRLPHFERLAWAQWTFDEIATGEPLARLLET